MKIQTRFHKENRAITARVVVHFPSSLIKQVYRLTDGYVFETINSTYYAESYVVVEISGNAIALIRAGVDPHTAMKMLGQGPLH